MSIMIPAPESLARKFYFAGTIEFPVRFYQFLLKCRRGCDESTNALAGEYKPLTDLFSKGCKGSFLSLFH